MTHPKRRPPSRTPAAVEALGALLGGATNDENLPGLRDNLVRTVMRLAIGFVLNHAGLPWNPAELMPTLGRPLLSPEAVESARALLAPSFQVPPGSLDRLLDQLGATYESILGYDLAANSTGTRRELLPSPRRRRTGSHYSSPDLARQVVDRTLRPLIDRLGPDPTASQIASLRVCDPAMGTGAFVLEVCRQLADKAAQASTPHADPGLVARWRKTVAPHCVFGLDTDPVAVVVARACLQILAAEAGDSVPPCIDGLRWGDALLGLWNKQIAACSLDQEVAFPTNRRRLDGDHARRFGDAMIASFLAHGTKRERRLALAKLASDSQDAHVAALAECCEAPPFHWELEFPAVFEAGGFDGMTGNPPWVAFAGRAAQPLHPALFDYYLQTFSAFHSYRTLHGLFVERCTQLVRPGGRIGLIVPTSIADLDGYGPVRRTHNATCTADDNLPDFGSAAFEGVFQPAMALLSTKRAPAESVVAVAATWSIARTDLDETAVSLLARLKTLPVLPRETFGERGYQTMGSDVKALVAREQAGGSSRVALREGADIRAFARGQARYSVDPKRLAGRFRVPLEWGEVDVLIRQTARFPIAARSDGEAFRNSILAGFAREPWTAASLVAYLNATPVRWLHYVRFRDARQGMPQVKIGHLRAIPGLEQHGSAMAELDRIGASLSARNEGISVDEQAALDAVVERAWGLTEEEVGMIGTWARTMGGSVRGGVRSAGRPCRHDGWQSSKRQPP